MAQGPGISYKDSEGGKLEVSQLTVDHVIKVISEFFKMVFQWAGEHPEQFMVFLVFLAFIYWVRARKKVDLERLKVQYDKCRLSTRESLSPPLPFSDLEGARDISENQEHK